MQRSKFFAVALATLMALATSIVFFTGGAAASQWHAYEGDIHPGHAYGLLVPDGAENVEIAFTKDVTDASTDAAPAAARLSIFNPAGDLVAYYALGESPSTATIVQPDAGRYIIYVYEVTGGALSVRVSADEAPAKLDLQKVPLAREDVVLTRVDSPAALDQVFTVDLHLTPVFVTLLYDGSTTNLDATVASTRGTVVTVTDESGTAFSPGVWSSQTGTRVSDAANLAPGAYTVTAKADRFEGTLVLTSLALDLAHEDVEPVIDDIPVPPVDTAAAGFFELPVRDAVAVVLDAGALTFADAEYLEDVAAQEDGEDTSYHYYSASRIIVYTPQDEILTIVDLNDDEPTTTIDIPEAGEYVFFVSFANGDMVFALAPEALVAPSMRTLETYESVFSFTPDMFGMFEEAYELDAIPLDMQIYSDGLISAAASVQVENDMGVVAATQEFVGFPFGAAVVCHSEALPENFATGTHLVYASGLSFDRTYDVVSLHYARESILVEEVEVADVEAEEEPADDGNDDDDALNTPIGNVWDLIPSLW